MPLLVKGRDIPACVTSAHLVVHTVDLSSKKNFLNLSTVISQRCAYYNHIFCVTDPDLRILKAGNGRKIKNFRA
jgi:hypothetical protein